MLFKKKNEASSNEELVKKLNEYYQESYRSSKQRRENWKKYYGYWTNQSLSPNRSKTRSDTQVNYSYLITAIKTPVMTQNKPRANFIALNNTDDREKKAALLSKLVGNALWNKLDIQEKLVDTITTSTIYDAGFWKVGWDADAENGIGEVFVSSIEPFKMFVDPVATEINNGRYMIHVEVYPVSYLKDKYPKFKDKITVDKKVSDILFEERKIARSLNGGAVVTDDTRFAIEKACEKEYWLAPSVCDQSITEVVETKEIEVEEPAQDEFGNPVFDENGMPVINKRMQVEEVKAPKYRNGRVVTVINDTVIVDDKPNPYEHGKFPFVKQVISRVPNEFWGMGDIEQCIPLFDALNHAYQQVDDILAMIANMGWTVDPSIGDVNLKRFMASLKNGGVGQVKVVPLDKIRQDTPPMLPAYLFNRIKDLVLRIEVLTGITDVLQGRGGITHRTARGIERIYESATSRMGLAIRLMELALKKVAYLMAATAQQFYDTDRTFSVVGTSNNIEEVFTISKNDISGEFDVSIDSGAALPQDKKSKAELVFDLMKNHIFEMALSDDPVQREIAKTVLDAVEFPGRETMLNFSKQQQMTQPPPETQTPPPGAGGEQLPPEAMELLNILSSAQPGQQI